MATPWSPDREIRDRMEHAVPRRKACPRGDVLPVSIGDDDRFCWRCGSALLQSGPVSCACGRVLASVDCFCPSCGKKVES